MKNVRLVLKKGKLRWRWQLRSKNGEIVGVSQGYYSKSNAKRAATRLSQSLGVEVEHA